MSKRKKRGRASPQSLSPRRIPAAKGEDLDVISRELGAGLLGPFGAGTVRFKAPRRVELLFQPAPGQKAPLVEELRRRGHHVLVPGDVSDALTILSATIPDMVVLGTLTLEMSALVSKLESSYSRGCVRSS